MSIHFVHVGILLREFAARVSVLTDFFTRIRFVPGLSRPHKPQEVTPIQQAQVTVMVSMPAPNRRPGGSSNEIAIGTAMVPYRDEDSDEEDMDEVFDRNGITYAYH